jgi:hypothetical protein
VPEEEPASRPEDGEHEADGGDADTVEQGDSFSPTPEDELDSGAHMQHHQEAGRVEFKGGGIGIDHADAGLVGELLGRLAGTLHELGRAALKNPGDWVAPPAVDDFSFSSLHIRLIVGDEESIRMDDSSPTLDAARQLTALMSADEDSLLSLAIEAGEPATRAYKTLLKSLVESDVVVEWTDYRSEGASIDPQRAIRDFAVLDREGTEEAGELRVPGHLSMVDSDRHAFALRLPKGAPRPAELKGRRKLGGELPESMARELKERNLWDSDVVATLRVVEERQGTAATPKGMKFELVGVEELIAKSEPDTDTNRSTNEGLF